MELVQGRSLDQVVAADGPFPPSAPRRWAGSCSMRWRQHTRRGAAPRREAEQRAALPGRPTVLTDFGIATAEGDPSLTQAGVVMGSPGFLAPERIRDGGATPPSTCGLSVPSCTPPWRGTGPTIARRCADDNGRGGHRGLVAARVSRSTLLDGFHAAYLVILVLAALGGILATVGYARRRLAASSPDGHTAAVLDTGAPEAVVDRTRADSRTRPVAAPWPRSDSYTVTTKTPRTDLHAPTRAAGTALRRAESAFDSHFIAGSAGLWSPSVMVMVRLRLDDTSGNMSGSPTDWIASRATWARCGLVHVSCIRREPATRLLGIALAGLLTCNHLGCGRRRRIASGVADRSPKRISPGAAPGLTWAFAWQVLDSDQGRHTSAILQASPIHGLTCGYTRRPSTSPAILRVCGRCCHLPPRPRSDASTSLAQGACRTPGRPGLASACDPPLPGHPIAATGRPGCQPLPGQGHPTVPARAVVQPSANAAPRGRVARVRTARRGQRDPRPRAARHGHAARPLLPTNARLRMICL
jgi:hypothetical protein